MDRRQRATRKSVGVFLTVGALAFFVGAGVAAYAMSLPHGYPDFVVFWTAAQHASDPLLYDPVHLTSAAAQTTGLRPAVALGYTNPPTFLPLLVPFGLIPYQTAYVLWSGLSSVALVWASAGLVRPGWAVVILPLTIPVLVAAALGQSVLLAVSAFIFGVLQLDRSPRLAGALFAVAACIKPQLMILSPLLLVGNWSAMRAAIVTGLLLVIASLPFGPRHWIEWFAQMPGFVHTVQGLAAAHRFPMVSLLGPDLPLAAKAVVIGSGLAFALWCSRRSPAEQIIGVICGSLCLTPYDARPDLVALAPSGLAWLLAANASWTKRATGAALLSGLVASPLGVALAMLAVSLQLGGSPMRRAFSRPPGSGGSGHAAAEAA
ncbi:MAG TPA: glycosyltransferase family 87 protein [Caulobacteraceae bacterium]|nr:glycosyltransferase family 87 protein [Caulobacteraceae bacterium]